MKVCFRMVLILISFTFGCTGPKSPNAPEAKQDVPSSPPQNTPDAPKAETSPLPTLNASSLTKKDGFRLGVLHTSNVAGELEDCGCNINPLGGLARRVHWVQTHRHLWDEVLLLDTGDLFTDGNILDAPGGADHEQVSARGALLVDAYNQMGCNGIALGDRDLLLGAKALKEMAARAKFPFLALNVTHTKTGLPLFENTVPIVEFDGKKFALYGLVSNKTPNSSRIEERGEFLVSDPYAALKKALDENQSKADLSIVMGHLRAGEAEVIAETFPRVTLVVGGQDIQSPDRLTWLDKTAMSQGGEKGKKIFATTLGLRNSAPLFFDPTKARYETSRIATLESKIKERSASLAEAKNDDTGEAANLGWLQKNIVKLKTELQTLQLDRLVLPEDAEETWNQMVFDAIELKTSLPEDTEVVKAVESLKKKHPGLLKKPPPLLEK